MHRPTDGSDTDRRGIFLAPTPLFWHFEKPPTHVEGPADEQFSWEVERFCELALREAFLSRRAHTTFVGYALGQHKRLEADVRLHGAPRWKHAMHLLRLLTSCRDLLRTGELTLDVGDQREPLLAVKRGEVSWREVESWMRRLAAEAEEAAPRTPLPAEPDQDRVADFLFRVRRASAVAA
ncbi:DNA polymerase beta superfamily protein [Streptomyces sp. NPDC051218]|uniref:nucleotidyltransferase domain-containing protein n=1 Tax=Streptomyces sp. NPDC051218 TaxID=3365645 RepID=UPI0037B27DD6